MGELEERINEIKESNMNSEIPPNAVSSLNDIIMEGAPSTIIEVIRQQVEELSQVVCTEQFNTDNKCIKKKKSLNLAKQLWIPESLGDTVPVQEDPN